MNKELDGLMKKFTQLTEERKMLERWHKQLTTRIIDINIEVDKIIERSEEIHRNEKGNT